MPPKTTEAAKGPVVLKRLDDAELEIHIEGMTPLIPHKWSDKALRLMRDKQTGEQGQVRAKREAKDPKAEADGATYWMADGTPGMPATAFKAATVDACRFFQGVTMVDAKQMLFVVGDGPDQLIAVHGEQELREDTPRNATGVADLRYRYQYFPWRATLVVRFMPSMITPASVVALVDAGGRGGVGDWRPSAPKSKTGTYGTYRVVENPETVS
jgi:hypothetical protein